MRSKIYLEFKTLVVDVGALVLLFLFGLYAKSRVAHFFEVVPQYEAQVQILEPGIADQSLEALLQFESVVGQFNQTVRLTYLFMVFIVPLVVFLLFSVSQSVNIGLLRKKKFDYMKVVKGFSLSLPLLVLFLLLESKFVSGFAFFAEKTSALVWFVGIILLFIFLSYVWSILVIQVFSNQKIHFKGIFKKFYSIYPLYILFCLGYSFVLLLVGFSLVRVLTSSFVASELISILVLGGAFLVGLQYFRSYLFRKVILQVVD
jgi:hypothetical protein